MEVLQQPVTEESEETLDSTEGESRLTLGGNSMQRRCAVSSLYSTPHN